MQRDNIKRHAVAAFRYYGQCERSQLPDILANDDFINILAARSTLLQLHREHKDTTLGIVRLTYFDLPPGDLPRGEISHRAKAAADKLNTSERYVWKELRRTCDLFDYWYASFTEQSWNARDLFDHWCASFTE